MIEPGQVNALPPNHTAEAYAEPNAVAGMYGDPLIVQADNVLAVRVGDDGQIVSLPLIGVLP